MATNLIPEGTPLTTDGEGSEVEFSGGIVTWYCYGVRDEASLSLLGRPSGSNGDFKELAELTNFNNAQNVQVEGAHTIKVRLVNAGATTSVWSELA